MTNTTILSSPGKVLLAGGYLVLDRQFSGLVVATSSRFYSCVKYIPGANDRETKISVRAGQFPGDQSTWEYALRATTQDGEAKLELVQSNEQAAGKNKFISIALVKVLEYTYFTVLTETSNPASAVEETIKRVRGDGHGLDVTVFADNDFYSQRESLSTLGLPTRLSSLPSIKPFTQLPRPIPQTNKTGLGSSAALTTSLTASLLSHLSIVDIPVGGGQVEKDTLDVVHGLAQLSHCLAQGKVGSGFDVSSAVYGSHIYTRFSPSVLKPLMDAPPFTTSILPQLEANNWDSRTTNFRLPKHLRLLLADVDAGTDTPSFVGKVLKWREEKKEEAKDVWERLDEANMGLEKVLRELVGVEMEQEYDQVMQKAADWTITDLERESSSSQTTALLLSLSKSLSQIRALMREMSDKSGVPIEPVEQSRLLDACGELKGVLGGGVPGAGGYDALYLLAIDHPSPIGRIDDLWASWTEMDVCPLSSRQSDGGLRGERMEDVVGLENALRRV